MGVLALGPALVREFWALVHEFWAFGLGPQICGLGPRICGLGPRIFKGISAFSFITGYWALWALSHEFLLEYLGGPRPKIRGMSMPAPPTAHASTATSKP